MYTYVVIYGVKGCKNFFKSYVVAKNEKNVEKLLNDFYHNSVYGFTIDSCEENFLTTEEKIIVTTNFSI